LVYGLQITDENVDGRVSGIRKLPWLIPELIQ